MAVEAHWEPKIKMYMFEIYVYQRTGHKGSKIRKLLSFTFMSAIMGHPVLHAEFQFCSNASLFVFPLIWLKI